MAARGDSSAAEAFRTVADERLARLDLTWVRLERSPGDAAVAHEMLRELHTLKGEAAMSGFTTVAELVHALEDVVQHVRAGRTERIDDLGDVVLEGLDLARELVIAAPGEGSERAAALSIRARAAIGVGEAASPESARPAEPRASGGAPAAVRVTGAQLDRLRDVVGEMLLTQTRLGNGSAALRQLKKASDATAGELDGLEVRLREDVQRMGALIGVLEDLTRELRMVPIGVLFERYPRAVRDLSRELGRQVDLECLGEDVAVDREVLSALGDPLLHLVRNAVDHGIEPPASRREAGKSEVGRLRLAAKLAGDEIIVEVDDDGAGIDPEKVRARAVEVGLLSAEEAGEASREQLMQCLFAPGMSTRSDVSGVSGRGVGLDVVQERLHALGGSVGLDSVPGQGCSFRIAAPVNTAISSVLLFRVGDGRYALPATSVVTVVDFESLPLVDTPNGPAVRFEGALVRLISMCTLLQERDHEGGDDRRSRVLILRAMDRLVALLDTRDHVQREAVLKSPSRMVRSRRLVSAALTLEDGSVALVLAPGEVAQQRWQSRRAEAAPVPTARPTVLVAEDSAIVRELVADSLRAHGVRVLVACDGQEALELLERERDVQLLVTDVEMPRRDGLSLIRAVREREGDVRIPTVVVSTRGSDSDKQAAVAAGADAYLVKSDFTREGLWALVSRFLGQ